MDEVADSCPIWRVPIRPEDIENRLSTSKDSGDYRNEVARFLSRIFPENTGFVAANLRQTDQSPN
jgi:hypothetical protein